MYTFDWGWPVPFCIWYPWSVVTLSCIVSPCLAPRFSSMASCSLKNVLQSLIRWLETLLPSRYA
jgi:hypothetical protein